MHLTPSPENTEAFVVKRAPQATILAFNKPQTCLSWAPWNGGKKTNVTHVANLTLEDPLNCPSERSALASLIRGRLDELSLPPKHAIAMLTAVPQDALRHSSLRDPGTGLTITALCTLGLGNALAPGDPALYNEELEVGNRRPGTINLMVSVNRKLTDCAQLELLAIVTQAKCAILARYARPSRLSGNTCLGTGTDCTAILSPIKHNVTLRYAGLHCKLAETTARAVMQATELALAAHLNFVSNQRLSLTAR